MNMSIHCINPDCPCPYPQAWEDLTCRKCETHLRLRNRYSARQRLGMREMVALYAAWDRQAKTERVIKVSKDTSLQAQGPFEREAVILARLRHAGIPEVIDTFSIALTHPQHRTLSCLVLEKIRGQTLKDLLDRHPNGYPASRALSWLRQAVEILAELHRNQIIHGNINSSNLVLRQDTGQLAIVDFSAAQQIDAAHSKLQSKSQQISSSHSPLEQTSGAVGPSADFYALGQIFIHLLTGKSLQALQDPSTGESRWHCYYPLLDKALADLLDEMVCPDIYRRPKSAAEIQTRLAKILPPNHSQQTRLHPTPTGKNSKRVPPRTTKPTPTKNLTEVIASWPIAIWLGEVCRDTSRAIVLSAIGASVGAGIGFGLDHWLPVGAQLDSLFSHGEDFLSLALPLHIRHLSKPAIFMFGLAGLGTALGLKKSESFDQSNQSGVEPWMGFFGYLFGWLSLQIAGDVGVQSLIPLSAIAITVLTLGLSLRSHFLVHAVVAAIGTAQVLAHSIDSDSGFLKVFFDLLSDTSVSTSANSSAFWSSFAFFSFLASNLGLWLGVSSYLVVPCLRFFGWR